MKSFISTLAPVMAIVATMMVATKPAVVSSYHMLGIYNNCPFDLWLASHSYPGSEQLFLSTNISQVLLQKSSSTINSVPDGWSGIIWARTECDAHGNCVTGGCGMDKQDCSKTGPSLAHTPVTIVHLSANSMNGDDHYKVDVTHGVNIPITIKPYDNIFDRNDPFGPISPLFCKMAGCSKSITNCPDELVYHGTTSDPNHIACRSPCQVYQNDEYCCTGEYASANKCDPKQWKFSSANYTLQNVFKNACENAQTYRFDVDHVDFQCHTATQDGADYRIDFCNPSSK